MQTLEIKDLSVDCELDGKARGAVRGGAADQTNANTMAAAIANETMTVVGNGSMFAGSTVFNVDGSSHNDLYQSVDQSNKKRAQVLFGLGLLESL